MYVCTCVSFGKMKMAGLRDDNRAARILDAREYM